MEWQEVPAPRRKADYAGKRLRLLETPPKQRHKYDYRPELPIRPGDMAQIWMRRSFRDAECMNVDIKSWPEDRILGLRWKCPFCAELHSVLIPESWIAEGKAIFVAPAVATQEATDGDSNCVPHQPPNAATVAIRKPADAGNGHREPAEGEEA